MRASPEHMKKIRSHILTSSEKGFREEGFNGLGINGLAKRAGMTSGAFYGHFSSKNQAFHEVIEKGMQDYADNIEQFQQQHGDTWRTAFLDFYLGMQHTSDLAHSCVVPALSADVVRAPEDTRQAYSEGMENVVSQLTGGDNDKASDALALVSLMAGSVMLARCASTAEQQQKILDAARNVADQLITKL